MECRARDKPQESAPRGDCLGSLLPMLVEGVMSRFLPSNRAEKEKRREQTQ